MENNKNYQPIDFLFYINNVENDHNTSNTLSLK